MKRASADAGTLFAAEVTKSVQELTVELLGGRRATGSVDSDEAAHRAVLRGLPGSALQELLSRIQILPRAAVLTALGVSERSLARRKAAPRALLPKDEADRLWRVAEALAHATRVFGNQVEAERWLQAPAIGLARHTPLELLHTQPGARMVFDHLTRIEYGIYA